MPPTTAGAAKTCKLGTSLTPGALGNCFIYTLATATATDPTCSNCNTGYILLNNVCQPFPTTLPANCLQFNLAGTCQQCSTNFYFDGTSCASVGSNTLNCYLFGTSATTCVQCSASGSPQYFLIGSLCYQMPVPNCLHLTSATKCAYCKTGFDLDPTTLQCIATSAAGNCASQTTNTACALCNTDYYLKADKTCEKRVYTVAGCLYYSAPSTCAVCTTGNYLSSTGACAPVTAPGIVGCQLYSSATECSLCNSGYALSGDKKLCLQYCLVVGTSGCTQCAASYFYDATAKACTLTDSTSCVYFGQSVTECTGCSTGLVLLNSACVAPSEVGDVCTSRGTPTCLICQTGFSYNSSTVLCVSNSSVPANCKYSNLDGTCISCKEIAYSNNGVCTLLPTSPPTCSCYGSRTYFWAGTA